MSSLTTATANKLVNMQDGWEEKKYWEKLSVSFFLLPIGL
jgi:hypothetical protein